MKIGIWPVLALVAFTALVTWGISRPQSAALLQQSTQGQVLAAVGDHQVTRQEVEEIAPDQFIQVKQQLYDITNRALDEAIDRRLVDLEAEKEGIEADSLISREILAKLGEPTEAQVDSIYNLYRAQLNDAPRDSVAPQIRDFLTRQQRGVALQAYLAQLRERYDVRNYLEPARVEVEATGPSLGPDGAPITLVLFSDFECPFCVRFLPTLDQVEDRYGDQVRLVYRQFPLNAIHPHAQLAAEASLCANAQDRFWEMHDAIFDVRGQVDPDGLKTMAADLGLNADAFNACLDSGEFRHQVAADVSAGQKAGVTGTPAIFINGRYLSGAQPFSVVSRLIDDELTRLGS
ncbi:MAG: thioredoxin domain-containing protein [Candidatus Palauibacterales bacterium]|nr:thioredoxin domain-containing protein [Candidatus Palauibacterales bacterium]